MLKKEVLAGLNKQIQYELGAEYNYLALAVWFEGQVLKGLAAYFRKQAVEEQTHALKLLNFVQDRGGKVVLGELAAPKQEFANVLAALKHAQGMERANTAAINALYATAVKAEDLATQQHLNWFIMEQVEEEKWSDEFVALGERIGASVGALFAFDHQVGKKAEKD